MIAAILAGVIALWMASGMLMGKPVGEDTQTQAKPAVVQDIVVEVMDQHAEPVTSYIIAQGNVIPNREVTLRAQTAGRVSEVLGIEGQVVAMGDVIARLDIDALAGGIYVSGLPGQAKIITAGQGFVNIGPKVVFVPAAAPACRRIPTNRVSRKSILPCFQCSVWPCRDLCRNANWSPSPVI